MRKLRSIVMSLMALIVLMSIPNRADAFFFPVVIGITECNEIQVASIIGPIGPPIPVDGVMQGECLEGITFNLFGNGYFAIGSKGNIYKIDIEPNLFVKFIAKAKLIKAIPPSFLSNKFPITYNSLTGQLKLISAFNEIVQVDPQTGRMDVTTPFAYAPNDPLGKTTPNIAAFSFDEKSTKQTGVPTFLGLDPLADALVQLRILGNNVELKSVASLGFDADQNRPVGLSIFGDQNIITLTKQGENRGKTFVIDENGNVKEKQTLTVDFESVVLAPFITRFGSGVVQPATTAINNRSGASGLLAQGIVGMAGNQGGITIEVFDNAKGKPAERNDVSEVKVRVKKGDRVVAEGLAVFDKAGLYTFNYTSNEAGIHTIEVEGKSANDDLFFSTAQQQWVGPTTILDVEKRGKKLLVSGAFNANDQVFINGQKQKTAPDSAAPESILIAKKGGKITQDGARIIVKGNSESNEFVFGQTIIDAACHLSPPQVSSRAGTEQELTLQVFANGKLADPDPSSARFDVSRMVTASDEVLVTGGSGSRQGVGVFSFKYSSSQPRLDTIRAGGTIKGRSFSCVAFKSWTAGQ
jgi:hypothetical protein